ncbi:MAG: helix-turn-helix domain-containing protein [Nitrospirota bacterium]|jgi:DNA-binding protein Fis
MPKERLLVVSSDNATYQKINKALKKKVAEIVHTRTPIETISELEKTSFTGIFIDVGDKKIKGSRIIEKIDAHSDSAIIIYIFPRTQINQASRVIDRPFYNYLLKPFHPAEAAMLFSRAERFDALNKEVQRLKPHSKTASAEGRDAGHDQQAENHPSSLEGFIEERLNRFVKKLNGTKGANLYNMIITEIERPLISLAIKETKGNQIKAANLLGINRNTLRKKIQELKIITRIESA